VAVTCGLECPSLLLISIIGNDSACILLAGSTNHGAHCGHDGSYEWRIRLCPDADQGTARIEVEPEQLLEQVFDGFASALEYLACTFDGANPDVLAGLCGAFAQVACSVNGMQSHQVSGGFPCSFSCAPGAFCSALADISSATAHIMFSAGVGSGFRRGRC
jgi:hypothetical protein